MLAEIKGKLGVNNIGQAERLEDQLTGNVFGTLRYLPFSQGIKPILLHARSEDQLFSTLLQEIVGSHCEVELWRGSQNCEIDVYIKTESTPIGIEVKYLNGLSGENQLEIEATTIYNEWHKNKESLLILLAARKDARKIYHDNYLKPCFEHVHLGYLTWEDFLKSLSEIATHSLYEEMIVHDLQELLLKKGFVSFDGFSLVEKGELEMSLSKNIHTAFSVVYQCQQAAAKLINQLQNEFVKSKYRMLSNSFLRNNTDQSVDGWCYKSLILLYQRKADGSKKTKKLVNADIYVVEINFFDYDTPQLIVARMDFGDVSQADVKTVHVNYHDRYYNPIHNIDGFMEITEEPRTEQGDIMFRITPLEGEEKRLPSKYKDFQRGIAIRMELVLLDADNYLEKVFRAVEDLSTMEY